MAVMYIGQNNQAKKVKKFYLGINNQSKKVKKAYIGVNGQAKLFYKNTVLPERYQQIEYLGATMYNSYDFKINTGVVGRTTNPRIVCKFKVTDVGDGKLSVFECGKFSPNDDAGKSISLYFGSDEGWYETRGNDNPIGVNSIQTLYDNFLVLYDNSVQRWNSSGYTSTPYYVDSRYYNTYPTNEKISKNYMYTVDYNNRTDGTSKFYLYADGGYYSTASHNLMCYFSSPSFYSDNSTFIFMKGNAWTTNAVLYYSLKMYNTSGNCIRNFYPCLDTQTEYYGFYDLQNGSFYSTNSKGASSDKNPHLIIGPNYVNEL